MNYTLYIDESGDFISQKGKWIISGLLVEGSLLDCNNSLNNIFSTIPSKCGVNSIKDFHLTEFRQKFGHEKSLEYAKLLLNSLDNISNNYYMLAAVNFTKSHLSEREMTW